MPRGSSVRRMLHGAAGGTRSPATEPSLGPRSQGGGGVLCWRAALARVSRSPSAGWRVGVVAAGGDVHVIEQGAQQLLGVLIGGGRGSPHLAEVVAESQDRCPPGRGEGLRPDGFAAGELGFGFGELLQGGIPFGFL